MKFFNNLLLVLFISGGVVACQGSKKSSTDNHVIEPTDISKEYEIVNKDRQLAIVYKTKADFYENIPVIMNDDRTEIISYPSPIDVYYNGELSRPLKLQNGYLLDNRGISKNVVFLNYTYEEYSKMEDTPSLSDMKNNIKEKYPLKELIECGSRSQYHNEAKELNELIDGGFPGCRKIDLY